MDLNNLIETLSRAQQAIDLLADISSSINMYSGEVQSIDGNRIEKDTLEKLRKFNNFDDGE